ncbi:MAG: TonB-dependent receptor [Bacteroidetes bacterium]|nr:TonB-dependent receptor [Bacteroidota bacterium]
MKTRILFLLFFTASQCLSAKEFEGGSIKGILADQQNNPIPFATVILKNSSDSSLYKGEITNEKGEFNFENIKEGSFFLQVHMTGFEQLNRPLEMHSTSPVLDLGTITLAPASKELQTVTVAAERPFIERQIDKTVVNIENSIVQTGSSIMEVMEKLPGVMVDQDGNISLKGKQGVIIMIDGKPTVLSGQDLANMLRGMPSSSIQKIEIITNPSAKYDAAGNAGIINIIMKKNRRDGFNGNVSTGYGLGRYAKYNGSLSLNFKKKWYNLFLNYSYSNRKGFNNLVLNRKFYEGDTLNTVFETDDYIIFPFSTHTPRLGADFYLSKKTTLSVLGTGVINQFQPSANNHTDIYDGHHNRVSSYDFINASHDQWFNYSLNAELKQQFDTTGKELTVDLDYARYWNITDQLFTTTSRDGSDSTLGTTYLTGKQNGMLTLYSLKADYTNPLKNNAKLDAGLKSSYVSSNKNAEFYNRTNSGDAFDSLRSSHFLYSENINAAYLNFSKEFKKISLQLGLRTEHTAANGRQLMNGRSFTRNYVQVFPTAFFDFKLNKDHDINLSAGRRIDRPGYDQMNPFKRLIDATTYSEGNPYLRPQLTYNTELTYSYKSMFFATASYSLTTDNITDVLIQDSETRTTVQTIVNLNKFNYYSLNLSFSKRLAKWWTTNTSLLSYYGVYTGTINKYTINQGIPSFYINTSNSFSIMDGFSAEVSFEYNYKNLYGVTLIKPNSNLTLGLQKSILKKRGTITLNVSDVFWNAYPSGITDFGNVNENWTAVRDTRVVNLNISYKFGDGKGSRMRRNTGADDEKSRIGSN